ncbi:MAG: hypothetical protein Q8P46_06780 [Hyphomicrobiales bacterium]|nr:hypothetical protein [Hyphomicrobiales bacterium]
MTTDEKATIARVADYLDALEQKIVLAADEGVLIMDFAAPSAVAEKLRGLLAGGTAK